MFRMSAVMVVLALCSAGAMANLSNGDFENCTLINQNNWTAGTDLLNQWYAGPNTAIVGSAGNKYFANQVTGNESGFTLVRNTLQAIANPGTGTYTFDVSMQAGTDYFNQFFGFNVLLAKNGAVIPLQQFGIYVPAGMLPPANCADLLDWDPGEAAFTGNWQNISTTFTITPAQAVAYDYLVFYSWTDRNLASQMPANLDNFSTNAGPSAPPVPEPITMSLIGLGLAGLGGYIRRRVQA